MSSSWWTYGPRQAIGCCDQHQVKVGLGNLIAQTVKARPLQTRPALAIIAEHLLILPGPSMCLAVRSQALTLLLDSLRLRLLLG
jgi:hypothetical protein